MAVAGVWMLTAAARAAARDHCIARRASPAVRHATLLHATPAGYLKVLAQMSKRVGLRRCHTAMAWPVALTAMRG